MPDVVTVQGVQGGGRTIRRVQRMEDLEEERAAVIMD